MPEPEGPLSGFAIVPDDAASAPVTQAAHTPGGWQDTDLERAIGAAQQTGLSSYRVEIAPDSTIAIVVGAQTATEPDPDTP